ncbi:WD40-repeat-containing domain protein [Xylariaceae sp. FL1651]|nr:WD40-repeat-containing domain protein [Xylariaceae sp. FL1651]
MKTSMAGYNRPLSFSERRGSVMSCGEELTLSTTGPGPVIVNQRMDKMAQPRPRGPPTPSMSTPAPEFDQQQLTGSPPPPPTPAASPGPSNAQPDWSDAADDEDFFLATVRQHFKHCSGPHRNRILADLLNMCTTQQLSFVHQFVSPLLKKDPFTSLPDELCLRILSFIDDPQVLARASQVSRRWRDLLSDDVTWKNLCVKHDYGRRLSEVSYGMPIYTASRPSVLPLSDPEYANHSFPGALPVTSSFHSASKSVDGSASPGEAGRPKLRSYKSHFKQRYLVESAWRTGGRHTTRTITQDGRVVTSLHLTPKYIVVALDNARIHIFDREGNALRTLQGHIMGVWAMVPWEDILVSGGCDRDVRVWDMTNGACLHTLRGHTSTVRCLKMSDANTAISGSRDTTLRVWDIKQGVCRNVLVGHQASVRCLEIKGDIVVSGSYDATAKIWSISEGRCLHTLTGHFSQIYAIAFDGQRVVTGSLDTSVRVWDAHNGEPIAVLQGHTSLVGQLQLRGNTLVTGGSDGSVRVWSLEKMCPIHRLAAHDNSVTSLQFDDTRVVSGGSDGRVKVWDVKTGHLVRELITAESVWRVVFEDEKCVAVANRGSRVMMEVWSFSPPEDAYCERPTSLPQRLAEPSPNGPLTADFRRSALGLTKSTLEEDLSSQDVDMRDADPSTAPLAGNTTFFHDD